MPQTRRALTPKIFIFFHNNPVGCSKNGGEIRPPTPAQRAFTDAKNKKCFAKRRRAILELPSAPGRWHHHSRV